jgi:DNA-binding transcriptional MerR regulator
MSAMSNEATPTFNLKAVVRETGVKPDTLRAWERRYGLPNPDRTKGGHRLYSQHDIDTVRWLVERQSEGLTISRAVKLWRSLEKEGNNPLLTPPYAATSASSARLIKGRAMTDLRRQWLESCMNFDETEAANVLAQAFALYPAEAVCFEILQHSMAEVGDRWYRGEATVQQEHFTTSLALRRIEALIAALPLPTRPGHILIACPPGEQHTFSPLMVTYLLKRRGWTVFYLGANVPADRLEATLKSTRPNAIVLTAQRMTTAASLYEMAKSLLRLKVPIGYGGRIFNAHADIRQRIPGHYLGPELSGSIDAIEHLLATSRAQPAAESVPPEFQAASEHFRVKRNRIETAAIARLSEGKIEAANLGIAMQEFGDLVASALVLGLPAYIHPEVDWIGGYLGRKQVSIDGLNLFLAAYAQALEEEMPESAKLITAEIRRQASPHPRSAGNTRKRTR